jgi:hypothetical protein
MRVYVRPDFVVAALERELAKASGRHERLAIGLELLAARAFAKRGREILCGIESEASLARRARVGDGEHLVIAPGFDVALRLNEPACMEGSALPERVVEEAIALTFTVPAEELPLDKVPAGEIELLG